MFHVEHVPRGTLKTLMNSSQKHIGKLVDLFTEEIYDAEIVVRNGKIQSIEKSSTKSSSYILPGLVDSHIHIESSMLTPQHFSRIAVSHGTVATVSDPHEIANVLGLDGVRYMIENALGAELKFFFGAPSCVPATSFESSGAEISADDIEYLFEKKGLKFLSEMMNYPGVIYDDPEVIRKIEIAKRHKRKIDGHAPGLTGANLVKYIQAGIDTDHECSGIEEALEKIERGMIVQIREGSAAKNFDALWTLVDKFPDMVFLCSDDLHPDDLLDGHINKLLKKGVEKGINLFNLLRAVSINPIRHYDLPVGLLKVGNSADFIRVDDLVSFRVSETYIGGKKVFDRLEGLKEVPPQRILNKFEAKRIEENSLVVPPKSNSVKVITVEDGELLTKFFVASLEAVQDDLVSDISQDILKMAVLNRYENEMPSLAFINNFSLKKGALASSISHDSHNIIAVGVSNTEIAECINWIIDNRGGVAVHDGIGVTGIPLPIAGIISDQKAETVASLYKNINNVAEGIGCSLKAPFMTLSFMALLVIPDLKLSNKGLFDGCNFCFTSLYE